MRRTMVPTGGHVGAPTRGVRTATRRRGWLGTQAANRFVAAFALSAPALLILGVFWFWPVVDAVRFSFYDYNLLAGTLRWAGGQNYVRATTDTTLAQSFVVTVLYFLWRVPAQVALALALALLVRSAMRGIGFARTLILLPTVTPMVVVAVVFGMMYHPTEGLLNSVLQSLGLPAQKFLISAEQALPSIAGLTIWKNVGMSMIFYLAGLTAIPATYYEAAKIDGANEWQQFRHITLPLLKGTTLFVVMTTTVYAFQVFTPVFVTTKGGPQNATQVLVLYIYDLAFRFNRMGYAAAVSVILAVVLIAISVAQFRLTRERRGKEAA